jgi:hypothetical protein
MTSGNSTTNTFSKMPDFAVYTCPSPIFFPKFLKFSIFFRGTIVEQLKNYIRFNRYMHRDYKDQYIVQKAKEIAHKLLYNTD